MCWWGGGERELSHTVSPSCASLSPPLSLSRCSPAALLPCTHLCSLVRNCCDKLNVTVPTLMMRTFAQDNATLWDWSADAGFDVAMIHLGTNDGNGDAAFVASFIAKYTWLLQALPNMTHSPNLMVFPSGGPNTLVFEPWVKQAMAAVPEVKTQFISYEGAEMNSCHHPSALGHSQMYAIAQPILAAALGW